MQERDIQIQRMNIELIDKEDRLKQRETDFQLKVLLLQQKDETLQQKLNDVSKLEIEVQRLQVGRPWLY